MAVTRRVVFGGEDSIPIKPIPPSLPERLNGAIRQFVTPLHRKTLSLARRRRALDTQAQLFKRHYNLCRKHSSLRGKTPAQAAGLANHQWTLREMLTLQYCYHFKGHVGSTLANQLEESHVSKKKLRPTKMAKRSFSAKKACDRFVRAATTTKNTGIASAPGS